jgi:peptidylprolyl isomerase
MLITNSVLAKEAEYIEVKQDNLLHLSLKDGIVSIRLAQDIAPNHSNYIRKLVNEGFYDGLPLYRVIENFVVQGGDAAQTKPSKVKRAMTAEFEWPISKSTLFTLVQSPDLLAEQTGYINGFAVGRSISENKEWLIHCPGVINLARSNDIHSGTTDFAILFGVSPRHLDRNMSAFGQVISGWNILYKVTRGPFDENAPPDTIKRAYMGSSLPQDEQASYMIENTNSAQFKARIAKRRLYENDFFKHKGNGNLDVCYVKPQIITQ